MSNYSKDFSPTIRKALKKKNINIIGITALPDEKGSYLNSTRGYIIEQNQEGKIRDYQGVEAMANG